MAADDRAGHEERSAPGKSRLAVFQAVDASGPVARQSAPPVRETRPRTCRRLPGAVSPGPRSRFPNRISGPRVDPPASANVGERCAPAFQVPGGLPDWNDGRPAAGARVSPAPAVAATSSRRVSQARRRPVPGLSDRRGC